MKKTTKNYKVLYCGIATLATAAAFAVTTDVKSVSADTVTTSTTTFVPSGFEDSSFLSSALGESKIQMSEGGNATYGRWEFKYTAEPYAFFYNAARDEWKMVQITSSTQHTINVMVDGYYKTYQRYLKGQYQ